MKIILSIALALLCITTGACAMTTQTSDSPKEIRKQLRAMITLYKSLEGSNKPDQFFATYDQINALIPTLQTAISDHDSYSNLLNQIKSLNEKYTAIAKEMAAQLDSLLDDTEEEKKS